VVWTEAEITELRQKNLPRHVAIIMDGNGRWAKSRGLSRSEGHRAGVETLKAIVRASRELEIAYLTVFAFSTENWKRPAEEVKTLMNLLVDYLKSDLNELTGNGIKLNTLGKIDDLPLAARRALKNALEKTKNSRDMQLNIALNYGGRAEIVEAARKFALEVKNGVRQPADLNEEMFDQYLFTAGCPDPDLIIRTSGELRLSNFLLWQSAYAEIWSTKIAWPDFKPEHLYQALDEYLSRERRFGGSGS